MANETGFTLIIDDKMLNKLSNADKKIEQLQKTSDKTSVAVISAFKQMSAGVDPLIDKLNEANGILSKMKSPKISFEGFKGMATDGEKAAKAAADISRYLNAMPKADNKSASTSVLAWQGVAENLKIQQQRLDVINRSVKEYENTMLRISSGKGGVVSREDTSGYQANLKEAESLRQTIELYKQKQQAIVNYQLEQKRSAENIARLKSLENESKSLPEQRKNDELRKMGEYYKALEASSKARQDQLDKESRASDKLAESERKRSANASNKAQSKVDSSALRSVEQYNNALNKTEVTIANRARKIEALANAERALIQTGRTYTLELSKIRSETERLNKANDDAANSTDKIKSRQNGLADTAGQLKRQFALLFSVSQIEGYVMKLINIRGEFELQNVALRAILKNKGEADLLFGKITELAVKSPFRVKDLVTYTKELAAYRVESDKLYDTTKMLADVSAGLGVDMSRLILAYGQVKAANYLRGTELRQFSEAGINILGELATYYSELENKMVSVADVQARVTKRMVAFGDVEEIFKRITSESGIFYNMQEIQAETLAGQWSNLQDSIDIMFNKIGIESDSILKGVIGILRGIIENYEKLIPILKAVAAGLLLLKLNAIASRASVIELATSLGVVNATIPKTLTLTQLLTVGFKKAVISVKALGASMKAFAVSNPYLLAFAAIAFAVSEAWTWNDKYNEKVDEINKNSQEQNGKLLDIALAYDQISKKAKDATKSSKEYSEADILKDKKAQLSELNELLKNSDLSLSIPVELITADNIDEVFKQGKELLEFAQGFGTEFAKAIAEGETSAQIGGLIGENLEQDLKDLSNAYSSVSGAAKAQLEAIVNDIGNIDIYSKLTKEAKGYYEEIRKGKDENEEDTDFYFRKLELTREINKTLKQHVGHGRYVSLLSSERELNRLIFKRRKIREQELEVQYELDKVISSFIKKYPEGYFDNLTKEQKVAILAEIDQEFEKKSLDAQTKRLASHYAASKFNIKVEVKEVVATKSFYSGWKSVVASLDTKNLFTSQLANIDSIADFEKALQSLYKEEKANLEVLNRANVKLLDLKKQLQSAEMELSAARMSTNREDIANGEAKVKSIKTASEETKKQIDSAKKESSEVIDAIIGIAKALNLNVSASTKAIDTTSQYISLIKEANKVYEKQLGYYDKEAAKLKTLESVRAAFQEAGIEPMLSTMEFDEQGTIDSLESMMAKAGDKGRMAIQKSLVEIRGQIGIDIQIEKQDALKSQIEALFSGYELSLELDNLNLPPDLVKQLFNFDSINLEDLKKELEALKPLDMGTEAYKEWDNAQKKITELQQKENINRLKTYSEYLKKTMSERINIELDTLKKIEDINKIKEFTPDQKKAAIKTVKKEQQVKLDRSDWKDFQSQDLYIRMFEDLEVTSTKTLDMMESKLIELKNSLKELSPTELKEIQNQLEKIREVKTERNPFSGLINGLKEYISLSKNKKKIDEEYIKSNANDAFYKKSLDRNKLSLAQAVKEEALAKKKIAINKDGTISGQKELIIASAKVESLTKEVSFSQKDLDISKDKTKELGNQKDAIDNANKTWRDSLSSVGSTFTSVSSAVGDIAESLENVFGSMDAKTKDIVDSTQEILGGIGEIASGIAKGGIEGYMQASVGLFKTMGSIFAIGDKRKERQIQREMEAIEKLQRSYEKLKKAIDNAYSLDTLNASNKAAKSNLQEQIASTQKAIAAEEGKKKTDSNRIKEMNEQIEAYKEQLKELEEQRIESLGGLGSEENYKSAAQEFADAWYDAYKETGDGLSGLEDTFDSFIDNIVKKQLLLRGTQKLLEPLLKMIDDTVSDGIVDMKEKEGIDEKWKEETKPALNALYKYLTEEIGIIGGESKSELSGLQRGIEGITATQSDALESILNSVRFFVADSNTAIKNLYGLFSNENMPNPILSELKAQTSLVRSIYDLFNGMTAPHPTLGRQSLLVTI